MPLTKSRIKSLISRLDALQQDALLLEKDFESAIKQVHPAFRKSARNLLHYLALRQHDIRELQAALAELGLSSLGRTESHVLASLQAVRRQLCFQYSEAATKEKKAVSFSESIKLLGTHTEDLLGTPPENRNARIMVTFSTEMATDFELVVRLMKTGMNCARINCAHDDEKTWKQMILNVKRAEKELNISCKILMDLMGPKLRTGALKPGPKLIAIHPIRDGQGRLVAPSNVWLSEAGEQAPFPVDANLPVNADWLNRLQEGDMLRFRDTRGRKRRFSVIRKMDNGILVHLFKTSYITTGTRIFQKHHKVIENTMEVGELPELEVPLLLKKDDFLVVHKEPFPGEPAQYDPWGHITKPAHISCTLPEVFSSVKVGQPILFDDGEIEGEIQEVNDDSLLVRITAANDKGSKLRADNGINLPDSDLQITGLSAKDKKDLHFIIKSADIVNVSFVNHPATVLEVQQILKKHRAGHISIMLKIETKTAFRNLPHILLAAMRAYPTGIMIARGDLAVECGWQRLAEVQEEILWLSEAAHIPVVWATQVLETLAKKGRPSRAEITDAAMAQRADCVMLNKGPHVVQAIHLLDKILKTMQEHQYKKTSMLRNLHVSELEHFDKETAKSNKQPEK